MQQQNTKYRDMFYNEALDDAEHERQLRLKNRRNGVAIFQATWILAFVSLAVSNLMLRSGSTEWPPLGVQRLNPLLPTIATVGLIASVWLVRRGTRLISADDVARFLVQWRAALLLGAAFVAVMLYEWLSVSPVPEAQILLANRTEVTTALSQYNAIFRVMTAFHMVHALAIGAYMFRVMRSAARGDVHAAEAWPAEAGAKLWYFVVTAWMIFYVVLYWI